MTTPRVTPVDPARPDAGRDDFADEPVRTPRQPPYSRPSQRELVRASLMAEHAYADYHGDAVTP